MQFNYNISSRSVHLTGNFTWLNVMAELCILTQLYKMFFFSYLDTLRGSSRQFPANPLCTQSPRTRGRYTPWFSASSRSSTWPSTSSSWTTRSTRRPLGTTTPATTTTQQIIVETCGRRASDTNVTYKHE